MSLALSCRSVGKIGQAARFLASGALGFALDATILVALEPLVGPFAAQFSAYAVSMLVTFALNRSWTFRAGASPWAGQWLRYIAVTGVGALAVNGLYSAAVVFGLPPLLALAIAALSWALAGYGLMHRWVFRQSPVSRLDAGGI